jgi:hypothetical protein
MTPGMTSGRGKERDQLMRRWPWIASSRRSGQALVAWGAPQLLPCRYLSSNRDQYLCYDYEYVITFQLFFEDLSVGMTDYHTRPRASALALLWQIKLGPGKHPPRYCRSCG